MHGPFAGYLKMNKILKEKTLTQRFWQVTLFGLLVLWILTPCGNLPVVISAFPGVWIFTAHLWEAAGEAEKEAGASFRTLHRESAMALKSERVSQTDFRSKIKTRKSGQNYFDHLKRKQGPWGDPACLSICCQSRQPVFKPRHPQ